MVIRFFASKDAVVRFKGKMRALPSNSVVHLKD